MENISIQQFKKEYVKKFEQLYAYRYDEGSSREHFVALGELVRNYYMNNWKSTIDEYKEKETKQVFYFSMEFLPGRMLKSNLLNLDILPVVEEGLRELGLDLDEVSMGEADPALGNGGLGRLASSFLVIRLDSHL